MQILTAPNENNVQSAIKPSFDCAKASSNTEKLVCSDSELVGLDLVLSNAPPMCTELYLAKSIIIL